MAKSLVLASLVLWVAVAAGGQEPLSTILERGCVAHWLVCGPFSPEPDAGIAEAVRQGVPALGTRDYMAPLGGIERLRPQHLNEVRTPQGVAYWQRAGATGPAFDLGPFFPEASEGVAYAGFYAQADTERLALVEVQSNLGVRAWINGTLVRDISARAFHDGGTFHIPVTFRPGLNFFVLEVPGVRYETLAKALGIPLEILTSRNLASRPSLSGRSGFEFALKLQPGRALGTIVHGVRLENVGPALVEGATRKQQVALPVVNNGNTVSQPIQVTARTPGLRTAVTEVIPPLQPDESKTVHLEVPLGLGADPVNVTVLVAMGDRNSTLSTAVTAGEAGAQGVVHVLTGVYEAQPPEGSVAEVAEHRIERFRNEMRLLDSEPKYGFDLGPGLYWQPALIAGLGERAALQQAFVDLRCATHLEMAALDERLVGDEVLARNILYGYHGGLALFDAPGRTYYAWDVPALAPQTPQLVGQAGGAIISNLSQPGLPPVFRHLGLDGHAVWHRRKQPGPGPVGVEELRVMADVQRQALQRAGLAADLFVNQSLGPAPEAFLLGACEALARGVPSIRFSGAGADELFRAADNAVVQGIFVPPSQARRLSIRDLREMVAQPDLKFAYAATEQLTLLAERAATAAAMLGAQYPSKSLDQAWRQLLAQGAPDRLGFAPSDEARVEMLAGLREAAWLARQVMDNSLAYLARQVDTYSDAPLRQDGARAVVVFNPSPWTRTDRCEIVVEGLESPGFALVDSAGRAVSCEIVPVQRPTATGGDLRGSFVAQDVPGFGWRTYYVVPGGAPVQPIASDAMQIENEYFWVTIGSESGGAITSVVDKATGKELAAGLWNDLAVYGGDGEDFSSGAETDRASRHTAAIRIEKHAAAQRALVDTDINGALYRRTIEVRPGISRIDCQLEVLQSASEAQDSRGRILAVTCDLDPDGRVPVTGERFGAVVARRNEATPAYRWAAIAPGDSIGTGTAAATLQPVTVVYDAPGSLLDAAKALQAALVRRGVPCALAPDVLPPRDPRWNDSTEFTTHNDDARASSAMRILLGGPDHNVLTKSVLMQVPKAAMSAFNERLPAGVSLYLEDAYTAEDVGPVPTLILAGATPDATARIAAEARAGLAAGGGFDVAQDLFLATTPKTPADEGMAVFFHGPRLFRFGRDGGMTLPLGEHDVESPMSVTYALYPFRGPWHDSLTAREAHGFNEPLQATVTNLHTSRHPAVLGLLTLEETNAPVTAIKPARTPEAEFSARETRLTDGLLVRAYDTSGRAHTAELKLFVSLREAYQTSVVEEHGPRLSMDVTRALVPMGPFEIKSVAVAPSPRVAQGAPEPLEAAQPHAASVLTRYWRHNRLGPLRGTPQVSLALEGHPAHTTNTIQVHIANNLADKPAEGTVLLSASNDWHLASERLTFNLPPRASESHQVVVMRKSPGGPTGGVFAKLNLAGTEVYDVLQLDPRVVEVQSTRQGSTIELTIKNLSTLSALFSAEVTASPWYWPEFRLHSDTLPRLISETIPPQAEQRLRIELGPAPPPAVVLKITANATVIYHPVRLD